MLGQDSGGVAKRARALLADQFATIGRRTDELFAWLMVLQWVAVICAALYNAPAVNASTHVWSAALLGGVASGVPLYLIWTRPGTVFSRQGVAVTQMLWSALIVHFLGSRPESQFHVFASLAILACYRDWRVLTTATAVVLGDHLIRGIAHSTLSAQSLVRFVGDQGWILSEVGFLLLAIRLSIREMFGLAIRQARLEERSHRIDAEYRDRTQSYRQYTEQLEKAKHELFVQAQEVRKARAEAEAAGAAKSQLVATVSHEIRTPMTAILGYADVLVAQAADAEMLKAATTIKRNGEFLLKLVDDILDLSKIEAGKLTVESIECSPRQIVEEVVQLMQVRADAKGLPLAVEFQDGLPETIVSDPMRLRQILVNLVGNAIKFSSRGTIHIRASLLYSTREQARLRIDVQDQGIGLTPRQVADLFHPFAQADESTARQFGGSGLGLSISKRLANLLGGDIEVYSSPGEGSTFTVTVAADRKDLSDTVCDAGDTATIRNVRAAVSPPVLKDLRVLVADDSPDNRELLAFVLDKSGASVQLAENGTQAVQAALAAQQRSHPFDAIVMDVEMPGLDGHAATQRLRSHGYSGPIIALTAHAEAEAMQRSRLSGCNACLTKPIDDSLLDLIARLAVPQPSSTPAPTA
ncbi:MAG: response regulator [Planctomycetota bacterium]|nr:MAG: response regulator [Planctomycetota bacterium]